MPPRWSTSHRCSALPRDKAAFERNEYLDACLAVADAAALFANLSEVRG